MLQVKATEQYKFPVALFIILCKVILTVASVNEMVRCDYSNETSSAFVSHASFCCLVLYRMNLGIFREFCVLPTL